MNEETYSMRAIKSLNLHRLGYRKLEQPSDLRAEELDHPAGQKPAKNLLYENYQLAFSGRHSKRQLVNVSLHRYSSRLFENVQKHLKLYFVYMYVCMLHVCILK